MGINDREFQKIVPNFVEMERAYEGIIRFWAQEVELMEGVKDSMDTYNQVSVYQLASSNAELVRRKLFSDIGDLRQIYWSKLNKKKLEERIPQNQLVVPRGYETHDIESIRDLTRPLEIRNQFLQSIPFELPRHGGFQAEAAHDTGPYCINYLPLPPNSVECKRCNHAQNDMIRRPGFSQNGNITKPAIDANTAGTKHATIDPEFLKKTFDEPHNNNVFGDLASTPANLYFEAGVLLERILPIIKSITKLYQNQPPVIRYEKQLATASNLIHNGLLDSRAFLRFVAIRNLLKENYFPTMG